MKGKKWFHETLYPDFQIGLLAKKELAVRKTGLQGIQVAETYRFGRTLFLDGIVQTTEKDEFIYHEMMAHVPLFASRNPKKVLIIGGGDGGILREVLKHPVEEVFLVEIDSKVIEFCKEYLPTISQNSFMDKRVKVIIDDGAKFVKNTKEKFDIVIVDSTDPIGPAKILFRKTFYKNILSILKHDGIMVRQSGSTILQKDEVKKNYKSLQELFNQVHVYLISVPTYTGGFFSITFASRKIDPAKKSKMRLEKQYKNKKLKTKYYNPETHKACFMLPEYVQGMLR